MSVARLERIAAVTKQSEGKIVLMQSPHGIETYAWLCLEAIARKKGEGWTVREVREPGHSLGCQEHDACVRERAIGIAERDAARMPAARGPLDEPEVF